MSIIYTVYLITNLVNGKFYIGCTKDTSQRWSYSGINYQANDQFFSDIRKDGWINFRKEVLFKTTNKEEAAFIEYFFIKLAKRTCRSQCYNTVGSPYDKLENYSEGTVFGILAQEDPSSPLRRFYTELTDDRDNEISLEDLTDNWE